MLKKDKIILWPNYFDSTKTRLEGRRVPKKLAILSPKLEEIERAAELLGFNPKIVSDAAHPNASRLKIGLITITKKGAKTRIMRKMAKKILEMRKKQIYKFTASKTSEKFK